MGQTATNHPQTITLPCCWVCEKRFVDSKPPGPAAREEHHVIPRAYGGVDGPTVSLCDTHHTALHMIARAMSAKKPYFVWTQHEPPVQKRKLMWLASRVYNAELVMKNDPNKATSVLIELNAQTQAMVDAVKRVYPQAKSREAVFLLALQRLYGAHFNDGVNQ